MKILFAVWFLMIANILFALSPDKKSLENDNPEQVLMIGNSFIYYNNGMHNPLVNLIRADKSLGKDHRIRKITINGSSLTWHNVKTYISNPFIGSFTFDKNNNLVNLEKKPFELAIMHDCSRCPISEATKPMFHKVVDVHSKTLKDANIEPALMMTWAYKDKSSMTKKLAKEYIDAANRNNILVIPVGLAFAEINKNFPAINLYTRDKRHPSKLGTYLAACVIFSSVYKKTPEGNSFLFGLDPNKAKIIQQVAWQVSSDFYTGK